MLLPPLYNKILRWTMVGDALALLSAESDLVCFVVVFVVVDGGAAGVVVSCGHRASNDALIYSVV